MAAGEGSGTDNRRTGTLYERKAEAYLTARGYQVLERNFCWKGGEIDLIAWEGGYLVFIEVKFRSDGRKGEALEAVGEIKRRRICRTARVYCMKRKIREDVPVRFDVVAVTGREIRLVKDAFWM